MPDREWITAASPGVPEHSRDALNTTLEGDDTFFISYVPSMAAASEKFGLDIPPNTPPGAETTLVVRGSNPFGRLIGRRLNEYFPLPGDHRAGYEAIIDQGLDACMAYYIKHKK